MTDVQPQQPRKQKFRQYLLIAREGLTSQALNIDPLNATDHRYNFRDLVTALVAAQHDGSDAIDRLIDQLARSVFDSGKDRIGDDVALQVVHSYGSDGPKLVRARASAERLLRANGFRLVPVTSYRTQALDVQDIALPLGVAPGDFLRNALVQPLRRQGLPLGEGIVVGVVDTGADMSHPRLAHAAFGGHCVVPGEDPLDFSACPQPGGNHGTHVSGIIAAEGDEGGPLGVAPNVRLRQYRVFPKAGKLAASNGNVIDAIRLAVDDGCHLINLSLGSRSAREDAVREAVADAWNSGVICIAAVGNDKRRSVSFPAAHPFCVGVSAVGHLDDVQGPPLEFSPRSGEDPDVFLADFSNIGPQVDATAPGVNVISTLPGGGTGAMSGTSMSAPVVTGMAALLMSRNPHVWSGLRNADRSEAILKLLVAQCRTLQLGSYDFEGFGLPRP